MAADDRATFLQRHCGGDPALADEWAEAVRDWEVLEAQADKPALTDMDWTDASAWRDPAILAMPQPLPPLAPTATYDDSRFQDHMWTFNRLGHVLNDLHPLFEFIEGSIRGGGRPLWLRCAAAAGTPGCRILAHCAGGRVDGLAAGRPG